MEKINFNFDWSYSRIGEKNKKKCELPHDAMIYEQRSLSSQGGINISYFEGYDYEYEKEFIIDKTLLDKLFIWNSKVFIKMLKYILIMNL